MARSRFIRDLKSGDKVKETLLCTRKIMPTDRSGHPFLSVVLADRSGEIDGLLWENAEEAASTFEASDLVRVEGKVVLFHGRMQLHLRTIHPCSSDGVDMEELLARAPVAEMQRSRERLCELLGSLKDRDLHALARLFLDDEAFMARLARSPAARSIHHAVVGGLLQHTVSVMGLGERICEHYKEAIPGLLNRDLVIMGCFLHDLGKVEELTSEANLRYTDPGRLLGHLVLGLGLLDERLAQLPDIPRPLADALRHIVVAHHDRLEHGSPKRPKLVEALVVHRADELDSSLASLHDIFRQVGDESWTPFIPHFDRYFFKAWPSGAGPRPAGPDDNSSEQPPGNASRKSAE